MTIQEARKVIGLNIHNLNGSMQMAVTTIMDALEEKAEIIGYLQPSEELEAEIDRLWESFADEMEGPHNLYDIYARLAHHFAEWQKQQMLKDAVEGKVLELGETYKDLTISVEGKELNEALHPLGVKDGDKVKVIIVKEDMI